MTIWVGAAYAALIALMTTKVFDQSQSPVLVSAALVTEIIAGAWFLGRTRVGFEWAATVIERMIEDHEVQATDTMPSTDAWPSNLDNQWFAALYLLAAAGATTLVAAWWGPVSSWL